MGKIIKLITKDMLKEKLDSISKILYGGKGISMKTLTSIQKQLDDIYQIVWNYKGYENLVDIYKYHDKLQKTVNHTVFCITQ